MKHNKPDNIKALKADLSSAPDSAVTVLASGLIATAERYETYRSALLLADPYDGQITRNFNRATYFTADHIHGAPWADEEGRLPDREFWNKGRRASMSDVTYTLDSQNLPVNPFINTGIIGRGIIGRYGPNHATDIGLLSVAEGAAGAASLYAWGIMKGPQRAFCGGFVDYDALDENGYIVSRDIWVENQTKEFFEEMISGSVSLTGKFAAALEEECRKGVEARVKSRGGAALSPDKVEQLKTQIETELKLKQVEEQDPEFLERLRDFFAQATECYAGAIVPCVRNTNQAWMEVFLSWREYDAKAQQSLLGDKYRFAAGDDATDVRAHKIDIQTLRESGGAHALNFLFMSASWLLKRQEVERPVPSSVITQLETLKKDVDWDMDYIC